MKLVSEEEGVIWDGCNVVMKHSGAIQEADSRNSQCGGVRLSPAVNLTFDLQLFSSSSSLLAVSCWSFLPSHFLASASLHLSPCCWESRTCCSALGNGGLTQTAVAFRAHRQHISSHSDRWQVTQTVSNVATWGDLPLPHFLCDRRSRGTAFTFSDLMARRPADKA